MKIPTLVPGWNPAKSPEPKEPDLTIVIAHRGPLMGLWATIESCFIDLKGSDLDFNFCIVTNGEQSTPEHGKIRHYLDKSGHLRDWVHVDAALSPPTARQVGTENANGKLLFFFDNHCLVERGYFKRAVEVMQNPEIDELHSTTAYYSGFDLGYHYNLRLHANFWGTGAFEPIDPEKPYRCAMGGHGGFVVRRSVWKEVDGYWRGFVGYAGEEPYFDLKMWLLGKQVWLDPKLVHYHFAGERPYPRHMTDDYYRNMLMVSRIIGGDAWFWKLAEKFQGQPRVTRSKLSEGPAAEVVPFCDIVDESYQRSTERAAWLAARRLQTLDELLEWFKTNGVAC